MHARATNETTIIITATMSATAAAMMSVLCASTPGSEVTSIGLRDNAQASLHLIWAQSEPIQFPDGVATNNEIGKRESNKKLTKGEGKREREREREREEEEEV